MLDTNSGGTSMRRYGRSHHQKNKEIIYLKAVMAEVEGNSFYKGFEDRVVGLFVSTYDLKPIGTPVAVSVKFPDGRQVGISGIVDWVREYHLMIPETEPGLGIKILSMENAAAGLIEDYLIDHNPLFFEGESVPSRTASATGGAYAPPPPTLSSRVLEADAFYSGLTMDIQAYLDRQCGHNTPRIPRMGSMKEVAPEAARTRDSVAVKAIAAPMKNTQFHGGFSVQDTGPKLFIETTAMRPVGTILALSIEMPGGWPIKGTCVVKWARRRNPLASSLVAPPGLGVCLTNINPSVWHHATCGCVIADNCLICEEI